MDGKDRCFFQVMSISFGQNLSKWLLVKPIGGLWLYTIFTTGFQKSNQVTVFGRRSLGNEFYKDIEYDEWFFGKDSHMFYSESSVGTAFQRV